MTPRVLPDGLSQPALLRRAASPRHPQGGRAELVVAVVVSGRDHRLRLRADEGVFGHEARCALAGCHRRARADEFPVPSRCSADPLLPWRSCHRGSRALHQPCVLLRGAGGNHHHAAGDGITAQHRHGGQCRRDHVGHAPRASPWLVCALTALCEMPSVSVPLWQR